MFVSSSAKNRHHDSLIKHIILYRRAVGSAMCTYIYIWWILRFLAYYMRWIQFCELGNATHTYTNMYILKPLVNWLFVNKQRALCCVRIFCIFGTKSKFNQNTHRLWFLHIWYYLSSIYSSSHRIRIRLSCCIYIFIYIYMVYHSPWHSAGRKWITYSLTWATLRTAPFKFAIAVVYFHVYNFNAKTLLF